ncbi:MAG: hypothetical protein ACR2QM_13130, partial [Longimicrobiales bacterium]
MYERRRSDRLAKWSQACALLGVTVFGAAQCAPASDSGEGLPEPESQTQAASGLAPQQAFWAALESLCGQAFEGRITESVPPDASFEGETMVMHVRHCEDKEIRIPFFVGADRSRTWVITPTADGLRLKHDHRHEDGS